MFFDLNVPVVAHQVHGATAQSKKNKGKQPQATSTVVFTPAQIAAIEARVDLLVHLGYSVIALNQTIEKKIDPKAHVNILNLLLPHLKSRTGVVFLKRLTINLDEDSEKGFGLTSVNASIVDAYDLIALAPTTAATFSASCLTHSQPSPLTAHVVSLPLTQPRLPFHLKHTLVRTAIKNGAVFEINYAGALGDLESSSTSLGVSDTSTGMTAKRNWWAAAREVVRVTKGKGIVVSGGVYGEGDYRAPRDVQNLIALLGLASNLAHDASTATPKSLVLRAQARKTYRAVLSEPRVIVPTQTSSSEHGANQAFTSTRSSSADVPATTESPVNVSLAAELGKLGGSNPRAHPVSKKRRWEADSGAGEPGVTAIGSEDVGSGSGSGASTSPTARAVTTTTPAIEDGSDQPVPVPSATGKSREREIKTHSVGQKRRRGQDSDTAAAAKTTNLHTNEYGSDSAPARKKKKKKKESVVEK